MVRLKCSLELMCNNDIEVPLKDCVLNLFSFKPKLFVFNECGEKLGGLKGIAKEI